MSALSSVKGTKRNHRKHPGIRGRAPHQHADRVRVADHNAWMRSERTPADQIRTLDARLGVGVGAVRERARLAKLVRGGR